MSMKSRVWRDRLELPRLELRLELPRLELPRLAISDANRSRASTPQFSRRASSLQTRIRTRGAVAQAASPSPPGAGSPGAVKRVSASVFLLQMTLRLHMQVIWVGASHSLTLLSEITQKNYQAQDMHLCLNLLWHLPLLLFPHAPFRLSLVWPPRACS